MDGQTIHAQYRADYLGNNTRPKNGSYDFDTAIDMIGLGTDAHGTVGLYLKIGRNLWRELSETEIKTGLNFDRDAAPDEVVKPRSASTAAALLVIPQCKDLLIRETGPYTNVDLPCTFLPGWDSPTGARVNVYAYDGDINGDGVSDSTSLLQWIYEDREPSIRYDTQYSIPPLSRHTISTRRDGAPATADTKNMIKG